MCGSGREATRLVRRPTRMYGRGRGSLPNVQEWSGDPRGCPGVVGKTYRMAVSGREVVPNVQE